jgi:RNA polymerase sigma-70 factor (ECF subfamily)
VALVFGFSFDAEYVRRLTEGDSETESHFTAYFGRLLLIKLRQRLRSPDQILEIRQETFVRVLTSLRQKQSLQHPERLGAFVNAVCNNVLLELGRSGKRITALEDDVTTEPETRAPADNPETSFATAEQTAIVRDVLATLPARDRELLRLVFLEEMDKDAVCAQMGVDREYLRVLVHRAKQKFRAAYSAVGQAEPV